MFLFLSSKGTYDKIQSEPEIRKLPQLDKRLAPKTSCFTVNSSFPPCGHWAHIRSHHLCLDYNAGPSQCNRKEKEADDQK